MMAASRFYFDKSPADLTLAEAAMLCGRLDTSAIGIEPTASPRGRPGSGGERSRCDGGESRDRCINGEDRKPTPPSSNLHRRWRGRLWFTDWVAKDAAGLAGSQTGIVPVRTTLVPALQRLAQQTLNEP